MADKAAEILGKVQVSDAVRARAWDAYYQSTSPDDFTARMRRLPLADSVKADLWDAKYQPAPKPVAVPQPAANVPGFDEQHPIAAKVLDAGSSTLGFIGNVLVGAGKSAAETILHPRAGEDVDLTYAYGKGLIPPDMVQNSRTGLPYHTRTVEEAENVKPHGVAQHIGAIVEQTAEMTATGGPLRNVASKIGRPLLARAARIGAEALNAGGSAALHGQNVPASMAFGAGGGALGETAQIVAPKLAESAMGIRAMDRMFGRTPGETILKEIPELTPKAVAETASRKALEFTEALESAAEQSTAKASLKPALQVVDAAIDTAKRENNSAMLSKLGAIRKQLTQDVTAAETGPVMSGLVDDAGRPILSAKQPASAEFGEVVSPRKLLDLKRGIGDLIDSWGPGGNSVKGVKKQIYHSLDAELDRALPGADALNQQISTLIAIAKRAKQTMNKSGLVQRVGQRVASHGGSAAIGGATGGLLGYEAGGKEGAAVGAVTGIVAPEVMATPSLRMLLSKGASKITPAAMRPMEATAMQGTKKK